MPNVVLVGAQWGDEGKGKIVDVLAERSDWVVRFQGGSNAGHTVIVGKRKHVLHLTPSGILHAEKRCVIGNGVVVDPLEMATEIEGLRGEGVECAGRLYLSSRAHLVLPHHRALDAGREERATAGGALGTTRRGIGPAYADKAARTGLRACALRSPRFAADAREALERGNEALAAAGLPPLNMETELARLTAAAAALAPYVTDTERLLNEAAARGESVLFEGAQGALLDLDFGTYPYVTSSNATAGGACVGTGLSPRRVDRVVGVLKAYTTRVGEGPFPTELTGALGERLRTAGGEYGATTGRPRRCGWFDAVLARYSAMVNGVDEWAVTKLDVLDGFETLRIATAYRLDGRPLDAPPADARDLARCEPVYEELPGWWGPLREARHPSDLPDHLRMYLARIEELTGVLVGMVSVGPDRCDTLEWKDAGAGRR